MNQTFVGYVSLLGSFALHGVAFTQSSNGHTRQRPPAAPSFVELTTPEPLPEPPATPPPAEPEPAPSRPPERPRPTPPVEEPTPEPPVASPEAPPELTGVTLTGGEGASFGAPGGSGGPREGAIVLGSARKVDAPRPRPVARSAPPKASAALPLSHLSRRPIPPSLRAMLERNYPREARKLGKSGEAKVRVRVEASGEVRAATLAFATSPDFGEACVRTLIGTRWSSPLDRGGMPAPTSLYYRCKFRID